MDMNIMVYGMADAFAELYYHYHAASNAALLLESYPVKTKAETISKITSAILFYVLFFKNGSYSSKLVILQYIFLEHTGISAKIVQIIPCVSVSVCSSGLSYRLTI